MSRGTTLLAGGLALLGTALTVQGIRKFATFDAAMTESLAIMGDVSTALENDMAQAAREMARQTIFSADQAAESYFFLASAGLDAKQSMAALPQVAQFAQAGMFDMARATELATDAQSALGLASDDTQENLKGLNRVTDTLVKANTLANATVEQFSESLTNRAAPRLRQLNKTIEEGVAALAVFADQGIKGRRAGTLLDMTLRELNRRARENEEAFKDMNVEVFREGEMRNMADIFEDLEDGLEGLSTKAKSAELAQLGFQQRSIRGILAILGQSEALREYQRELEKAGGITREVADKQLDTIIKQLGILGSEFSDIFISIGKAFGPGVQRQIESTISFIRDVREAAEVTEFAVEELGKDLDNLRPENLRRPESQAESELATVDPLRKEFLEVEDISGLLQVVRSIPPAFRDIARNVQLNEENVSRLRDVMGQLPQEAVPFVNNLAEAEAVIRRMEAGAPTVTAALLQAGVSAERLFGKLEDGRSEIEKLGGLPEDAEERQKLIDEMVNSSRNLISLTETRREAELGVTNQVGQLKGLRSDLNMALEESNLLNVEQEAAIRGVLNGVNTLLQEIARAPFVEELEGAVSQANNLKTAMGLVGRNIDTATIPFGKLLGAEERLNELLNNDNATLRERLDIAKEILGVQNAINQALSIEPDIKTLTNRGDTISQQRSRSRIQREEGGAVAGPRRNFVGLDETIDPDSFVNQSRQTGEEGANAFAEAFSSQKNRLATIGSNLILSLAQGATSAQDILKSTILSIAQIGIKSVIMGAFGISSPSTVMMGFGSNITIGLAEGLASEAGRVRSEWMNVLDEIEQPSIQSAISGRGASVLMQSSRSVMARQAKRFNPTLTFKLDMGELPAPKSPMDTIRDTQWQRFLRDSLDVAKQEGFDPSGGIEPRRDETPGRRN